MNANKLTNHQLWLPDWGRGTNDTIPTSGGRTLYMGAEVSFNRTARSVPQQARRD